MLGALPRTKHKGQFTVLRAQGEMHVAWASGRGKANSEEEKATKQNRTQA